MYAAITIALMIIAFASFLLVPQGASLGACNRLVIQSSRYTCLTGLALAQENSSICGYEPVSFADSCYVQVAEKSNSTSMCSGISNRSVFGECIDVTAVASGNYSACAGAEEPYASRCAAGVAVKLGNEALCASISNSTYESECTSIIAMRAAFATSNAMLCSEVSASYDRNVSGYIIRNVSAGVSAAYAQAGTALDVLAFLPNVTYTARDYCYITLATSSSNPALCQNVSAGDAATLCNEQASTSSTNVTENFTALLAACASTGAYAQGCADYVTLSQAVKTRNATLCARLPTGQDAECYTLLASTYSNSAYCSEISNASYRQSCISGS